jgi:hypothetical protein
VVERHGDPVIAGHHDPAGGGVTEPPDGDRLGPGG